MSSSDVVNYALRPNKAVERRVIFSCLREIADVLPLRNSRYIGFGSIWYVDFVLAHKILNTVDLISIEADAVTASRAEFNRPYSCVRVIEGSSSLVLPDLPLEEKPLVAWLDYDTSFDGPVLQDLALLARRAPSGSVVIATINAHRGRLPTHDSGGNEYANFRDKLRAVAGDLVSDPLPKNVHQTNGYPPYVAYLLFERFRRALRLAGREEGSIPLFNIFYEDGAPMVTVGMVIGSSDLLRSLSELTLRMPLPGFLDAATQHRIGVPPLTIREKVALDRLLPSLNDITPDLLLNEAGFLLKPAQIRGYSQYYKFYPTFGELTM